MYPKCSQNQQLQFHYNPISLATISHLSGLFPLVPWFQQTSISIFSYESFYVYWASLYPALFIQSMVNHKTTTSHPPYLPLSLLIVLYSKSTKLVKSNSLHRKVQENMVGERSLLTGLTLHSCALISGKSLMLSISSTTFPTPFSPNSLRRLYFFSLQNSQWHLSHPYSQITASSYYTNNDEVVRNFKN